MKFLRYALITIVGLLVVFLASLGIQSYRAQDTTPGLGLNATESLQPCPESPNCINSEAGDELHRMEPWELKTDISRGEVMQQIIQACEKLGDVEWVVKEIHENYVHGVFRSTIFRFPDDVEFLIDSENSLLHFRSASRVGYSDMGANRKRLEAIKHELSNLLEN